MSEEKRNRAMQIFEALSAVDEELLESSERGAAKGAEGCGHSQKNIQTNRNLFNRFPLGRFVAAAVCFVVLGALAFGIDRVYFQPKGTSQLEFTEDMAENAAPAEDAMPGEGGMAGQPESNAAQKEDVTQKEEQAALDAAKASEIVSLTETEARKRAVFGAYVPERIPEGFVFDFAAAAFAQEREESLQIGFVKGADEIVIIIRQESLEEYKKHSDSPVFQKEELSLELIEEQLQKAQDLGDTTSLGGCFTVYFENDNILVEYRGQAEAEEVLGMLQSMPVEVR